MKSVKSECSIQEYEVQIVAADGWRVTRALVACVTGTPVEAEFHGFEEWWFRREPWLEPEYAALLRFDSADAARLVRRRLETMADDLDLEVVEEWGPWERV